MPIRFRCVYCDKLLGIAKRKAGSVVNCPQCHQPLIVPTPEPEPEKTAAALSSSTSQPPPGAGKLFERDDFDDLLAGGATIRTPDEYRRRKRPKSSRTGVQSPLPPKPFPVEQSLPPPAPPPPLPGMHPPLATPAGVVLTTGKIILLIVVVLILIVAAFGGGIVVGRMVTTS